MTTGFDTPAPQGAARAAWPGLRARLAAAWQARPVPVRPAAAQPVTGGSFDRRSAQAIAVYGKRRGAALAGVNPSGLGVGNATHDNDAAVAGACTAGD